MCQKEIKTKDEKWFCSKKCEDEWKILNGELKESSNKKVKGRDTSG
jgi:frataxin-like iron-binding protein CyaY